MNLIFLDFDGVLNSTRYWFDNGQHLPIGRPNAIDPAAVAQLNQIIDQTGAYVVVSSSWRGRGSGADLQGILEQRGFTGEIIGCTPWLNTAYRHLEIEDYLRRFPFGNLRSAILDDDGDAWCDEGIPDARFFQTDFQIGLTDDHVSSVVEWFQGAA